MTYDEDDRFELPAVPARLEHLPVAAWREPVVIPTYDVLPPTRYPMFLERRVYQGSSGRVYPLPFHERVAREKVPRSWDAVHLENRWLRVMVLPELGGRLHVCVDRSNGYDVFYRNNVVKPALVGLAGPWISGGVEFNWPQHHRPATFMPVDVEIEEHDDGARTVWCGDLDPFSRMKGLHGITLHPDRAVLEVRVRLHNRTDDVQTFLWWANAAVAVRDHYQSFFPTDVTTVADHARRATTGFPRATTPYYGIDYPARVRDAEPDADRLDWYRSIPVPTSYMCIGSRQSFFGGYDHAVGAGFVHWADVGISPGKKQWTWGNDRFGHAWDRNLTDADGPYVELMAGVFTDNQPDFSFLAPAETKTFSQYWYPVQRIGVVHQATTEVALHAAPDGDTRVRLGVAVTRVRPGVEVALELPDGSAAWRSTTVDLAPGGPLQVLAELPRPVPWEQLAVVVRDGHGELLRWVPGQQRPAHEVVPAVEPPAPAGVAGVEELYLIGLHLAQYRHATRSPEPYWREALRRDPGDVRSLTALAARAHARAQYEEAAELLERAVDRLTTWNANPYDGEPHYRLGLALLRLGRQDDADEALAKAAWSQAWRAPAALERARRRCAAGDWAAALSLLDEALTLATGCLAARDLRVLVLRRLGREAAAQRQLTDTLAVDPLDWWARDLAGHPLTCDARTRLDVAQEYAAAGFVDDALRVAASAAVAAAGEAWTGVLPLAHYRRAQLLDAAGRSADAAAERRLAAAADSTWCFPAGLDDESALRAALRADPADGRAAGLLGHWLYDAGRGEEAARMWRLAVEVDPDDVVCWRNLALAAVNVDADLAHAGRCLDRAVAAAPRDARLRFERDQLAKRARVSPAERLSALEPVVDLVRERDDLTIEYVALLVAVGRAQEALHVLEEREFQPWEGGEGQALAAWERVRLVLAAQALGGGRAGSAEEHLRAAIDPPAHLGEAPHPLANRADLFLLLGDALAAQGRDDEARAAWTTASAFVGDFLLMSTEPHSEKTVACALALRRSGRHVEADQLLGGLEEYARALVGRPAKVDYFATSLPDLLLFDDDLAERQHTRALLLQAFACAGRDELAGARRLVEQVLDTDPNLAAAQDLSRALQPEGRRLLSGRWPAPSAAG